MSYQEIYDYVIVGGGSAGCVVAARLAEANVGKVLLIEAGGLAEQNPETLSADGFTLAFANDRVMWDRMSDKQSHCDNRSLYMGSGTGMGGSGSVNGMVYTRGDKKDYQQWPTGWQWQDVEPFFQQLETNLKVKPRSPTLYNDTCIAAAKSAGFKHKDKLIDGDLCGFLGYQTMNYDGTQRRSSYVAFLKDKNFANLTIKSRSKVRQLILDRHKKIAGVIYRQENRDRYCSVSKEVVLCSGALETPKLLMLSGIGPKFELAKHGIELVYDSPQVGSNLHDHPNVCVFYKAKQSPDSRYPQLYGFNRANHATYLPQDQADTCYVFYSAPASLKESMKRMLPAVMLPPRWFHNKTLRRILRGCVDIAFKLPILKNFLAQLYGIVVILGKPESRGKLTLNSADPDDQACISPNYYQNENDINTMVAGVKLAKQIAAQPALQAYGNFGLVAATHTEDNSKIAKWIKGATMTTFHYCGTCKMGESDLDPVNLELQLRGVQGIRIADASVIPETPVSALNAPSMMIGLRAADFILQQQPSHNSGRSQATTEPTIAAASNG